MLFAPIACGWVWFLFSAPGIQWNLKRFQHGQSIVFEDFLFDFSTKTATRYVDDYTAASLPPNAKGFSYRQRISRLPLDHVETPLWTQRVVRCTVFDHRAKRLVHNFKVSLEHDQYCHFVSERFYMTQSLFGIKWLDLNHGTESWQSIPNPEPGTPYINPHPSLPVFRCTYENSKLSQLRTTYLYRFDEEGQIRLLASWAHSKSASAINDVQYSGDRIYSVDSMGMNLESRSIIDGTLVEMVPFAAPLTSFKFSVLDDLLEEKGTYISFKGRVLSYPADGINTTRFHPVLSQDGKTCVWHRPLRSIVTDAETDEVLCEIEEPGERYEFLDSKTLISISPGWGMTLRQYDLSTGKTLLRWRPFWWMWPGLAFLLISSACWVWYWTQMPKPTSVSDSIRPVGLFWNWFDCFVLMTLSMVGLVARVLYTGNSDNTFRLAFSGAVAVSISGLFVTTYILIFHVHRWAIKILCMLCTSAIILIYFMPAFRIVPFEACKALSTVTLPTLIAMPIWLIANLVARIVCGRKYRQGTAPTRRHRIHLREILLITALAALVLIEFRPLMRGIGGLIAFDRDWFGLILITLCTWVGMATALTNRVEWTYVGRILCSTAIMIFALNLIMLATEGPFWPYRSLGGLAIIGTRAIVCSHVLAASHLLARCFNFTSRPHPRFARTQRSSSVFQLAHRTNEKEDDRTRRED